MAEVVLQPQLRIAFNRTSAQNKKLENNTRQYVTGRPGRGGSFATSNYS